MKRTQRRRFSRRTRRRQRGGAKGVRAYVYLALFSWILALVPALAKSTARDTTAWDVIQWTADDVGKAATKYFKEFNSGKATTIPVTQKDAMEAGEILTGLHKANAPGFKEAAKRVATLAVETYEAGDKLSVDFALVTAEKAGEVVVRAGAYVDDFFNGLSEMFTTAAKNLETGNPVLPLIQNEADEDEKAHPAAAENLEINQSYTFYPTGNFRGEGNEDFKNPTSATYMGIQEYDDVDNNGNDIKVKVYNLLREGVPYQVPIDAVTTTPLKGGRRKLRRKTLRRKK